MASLQQKLLPPPTKVDDTHKVYSVAVACVTLGVVASLTVISRFALRIRARAFGHDDWAMVPALVCYQSYIKNTQVLMLCPRLCTFAGPQWLGT
jgi:hypothetical protein